MLTVDSAQPTADWPRDYRGGCRHLDIASEPPKNTLQAGFDRDSYHKGVFIQVWYFANCTSLNGSRVCSLQVSGLSVERGDVHRRLRPDTTLPERSSISGAFADITAVRNLDSQVLETSEHIIAMAGRGRLACATAALALTTSSLIAMLVAALAGAAHKDLPLLRVNATDFSISSTFINDWTGVCRAKRRFDLRSAHAGMDDAFLGARSTNVTGADLGVPVLFDVSLWGYCYTPRRGDGTARVCSRPAFDWAGAALDGAGTALTRAVETRERKVTLPGYFTGNASVFEEFTLWAEMACVVALAALGVELYLGVVVARQGGGGAGGGSLSCGALFLAACVAAVAACSFAVLVSLMCLTLNSLTAWKGVIVEATWAFGAAWGAAGCAVGASWVWAFWGMLVCVRRWISPSEKGGRY